MTTMNITGIILAGGKNSRMGKAKSFLTIDNNRLIDRTLTTYRKLFNEIIIVTNDPLSYLEFSDAIVVTDIYKEKGALGGIYTGLFCAKYEFAFISACDMPFLNNDFISYMISLSGRHDIIVPQLADGYQPLHAIYSQKCLPAINRLINTNKLKITGFYNELRLLPINKEKTDSFNPEGRLFFNINTPEDLAEFSD